MIKGNFIGAAIVAIIYTVYILWNPLPEKWHMILTLVLLNALTIVLMAFAFRT
jgi:ABC-type polysaccharide/polyol phosphate export permease